MEDFRSKSMAMDNTCTNYSSNFNDNVNSSNSNPSGMRDLRCYSASYASSSVQNNAPMDIAAARGGGGEEWKFKKGKSTNGVGSKSWRISDPEVQRKKRVASYKAYTVEGKVKGSFRKSLRWIKDRCNLIIHGFR